MGIALRIFLFVLTFMLASLAPARGNTINDGRHAFAYDFANQPVSASGGNSTYAYDANLKRVKTVAGGKTAYTVYSRLTGGPLPWPSTPKIGPPDRFFGLRPTGSEVYRDAASDARTTDYVAAGAVAWREDYAPFGEWLLKPAAN